MDDEKKDAASEDEQEKAEQKLKEKIEGNDYDTDDYVEIKRSSRQFNVNLDRQLKDIPDYVTATNVKVKKKKSRVSAFVKIMFGFIIVCISVMLAIVILIASQDIFGLKKTSATYIVDIPKNSNVIKIADTLEEKGVIRSAFLFKAYYKVSRVQANFQFGTYQLNANMSYADIIEELEKYSTSKAETKIVFPEGVTLYDIAVLLQENEVCNAKEFLKTIDTESFGFEFEKNIWGNELRFHQLEGYAFPDTYNFFINESPISAAKRMLQNYENKVSAIMKEKAHATGLTQENIMIIASIVQREASKTEEMKRVASVYLNRLKAPKDFTKMQADPTRDYANQLKLQMDIIDQNVLDAYNTYVGEGLPPSPICNPGLDAIKAVLEPEETDYYYFCTNLKTGEFYYATTLAEHNKNVKKAGLRQ